MNICGYVACEFISSTRRTVRPLTVSFTIKSMASRLQRTPQWDRKFYFCFGILTNRNIYFHILLENILNSHNKIPVKIHVLIHSYAELVCDIDEDCSSPCLSDYCEYRWILRHRHTMSWRTFDHASEKWIDYPLEWVNGTLQIEEIGIKSNKRLPIDAEGNPKYPNDELENIIMGDGRSGRKVISVNNHVRG